VLNNFAVVSHYQIRRQKYVAALALVSFFFTLPALAVDKAAPEKPDKSPHTKLSRKQKIKTTNDVRVIVDISGSMKKTDPDNLRRPAVRLLAGLIPAGSRSGIWNFGRQVNMAVKIGPVNETWRELARKESKNISSAGLYTNIESALRKASFDWKEADPRYKRNLILLTDGHVDISKDGKENEASRKRILKEILPALEQAKVRVHSIALSDDVDEGLLTTLSAYTDGLYKKVSNADDLQKLFLQMLEQSVNLDSLPLKDNRFNVDASINDMTLLVFNKDKAHPTTIVTPGKRTWSIKKNSKEVNWFSDQGFDLITIKKPQQGQWKIMAPVDENNRVVVATNLKLQSNDLPGYLMLGDTLQVKAQLTEDNKPLTDERLLSKFNFVLKRKTGSAAETLHPMLKTKGEDLIYSVELAPIFKAGNNELVIQAKSPTAEREIRHQFTVYSTPAEIKIAEKQGQYEVKVIPYENLLRPDSVKINITLEDKSKQQLTRHDKDWSVLLDKKYHQKMFTLTIDAARADGKPITTSFNKMLAVHDSSQKLSLPVMQGKIKEDLHHEKKTAEKHEIKDKHHANKENKVEHTQKNENDINWTLIIISIVIGNLLIIGVLGGGYIYMKRRKAKMTAELNDEMKEDEVVKEKEETKEEVKEETKEETKDSKEAGKEEA